MNTYTYKTFPANWTPNLQNRDEARIAKARKDFDAYEDDEFYVIYCNGRMQSIEFWENFPYPMKTTELSAQANIEARMQDDLRAEQAAADEATQRQDNANLAQQVAEQQAVIDTLLVAALEV